MLDSKQCLNNINTNYPNVKFLNIHDFHMLHNIKI